MNEEILQIRLTSKQEHLSLSNTNETVSRHTDEKLLNEKVNNLLKQTHKEYHEPTAFSFIVKGELLRKTLGEHLAKDSFTKDSPVDVEYIQKTAEPELEDSILHKDWVSSIHTCAGKWILTGCFDNTVYVWNSCRKSLVPLGNHSDIVKDVKWVSRDEPQKGFVSVSYDQTAIIWLWEEGMKNAKAIASLNGHNRGIDCVAISPNNEKLATGSRDSNIKIWSASSENDDEPASKKSKNDSNIDSRVCLITLEGHKEAVTSVDWLDDCSIISSSMDHTVKVWDVEMNRMKNDIVAQKAILCSSWSGFSSSLLTSSADQFIRLYDPRVDKCDCLHLYSSHTQWVSSVKWSPFSEFLFVSGGYDGKVKMWDTRSPKEQLYELQGHEGQVLGVDWSSRNYIFSSGSDNYVHMFRSKS